MAYLCIIVASVGTFSRVGDLRFLSILNTELCSDYIYVQCEWKLFFIEIKW